FGLSLPGRPAAARADWLNNLERITMDGYKITNPDVTVWGDVAVVRTRQLFENSRTAGVPRPPGNDITDLWTRRDGRWQLVRRLSDVLHQPWPRVSCAQMRLAAWSLVSWWQLLPRSLTRSNSQRPSCMARSSTGREGLPSAM